MGEKEKQFMELFTEIGKLKELLPESDEVQVKVGVIQGYITENFYKCSMKVFGSLGQMYVADKRMKNSIDEAGGMGTAEFVAKAISIYC